MTEREALWAAVERRFLDDRHDEADLLADLLCMGRLSEARRRVNAWETWAEEDLAEQLAQELLHASYWCLSADDRRFIDELVELERSGERG